MLWGVTIEYIYHGNNLIRAIGSKIAVDWSGGYQNVVKRVCRVHSEGVFGKYLVLPSLRALLRHPVQKNNFAVIKKNLSTPSWNNF